MNEPTWIDTVTAIGSIATPILVLALTAVGWKMRANIERRLSLEEKLREDRIKTYNQILEPFIILLTTNAAWQTDRKNRSKDKNEVALQKMLSLEYREQGFKMSLIGSDAVVKAYNDLFQYFYQRNKATEDGVTLDNDVIHMMSLLGTFLLEIRKSMGNDATGLDRWDMLEWFITDARTYRKKN